MKAFLKKYLPSPIKKIILYVKSRSIDKIYKIYLVKKMSQRHIKFISNLKDKKRVKVVFFVLHESTWKVDSVFQKMLEDEFFEPIILVCPYVVYGEERMFSDMQKTYKYFMDKNYPVISSYDEKSQHWLDLKEISPDIVFFTNPHNLTRREYYEDTYLNYLSCFCGYGYIVSEYGNGIPNFDQNFHAALWLNFAMDHYAWIGFKKYSSGKGGNVVLSGFPAIERLIVGKLQKSSWKHKDQRLKIIFAPHHTIESNFELQLSNFLKYASFFQDTAIKYQKDIVWCFKPHPLLKAKLYLDTQWGQDKTDKYYLWWSNQENTQYCEGEYDDLFIESDGMIHDSGSFLIEYLTQRKSVLYLVSPNTKNTLNTLALRALDAAQQAKSEEEIESFIVQLISGNKKITEKHEKFYNEEFINLYKPKLPSTRIIECIKKEILG